MCINLAPLSQVVDTVERCYLVSQIFISQMLTRFGHTPATVEWCYSPRYLCGCAHNDMCTLCTAQWLCTPHNDTAETLCDSQKTIWLVRTAIIQLFVQNKNQPALLYNSQNYIFVLSVFSCPTVPKIYLLSTGTGTLTAEVGLQAEQFIGILLLAKL